MALSFILRELVEKAQCDPRFQHKPTSQVHSTQLGIERMIVVTEQVIVARCHEVIEFIFSNAHVKD